MLVLTRKENESVVVDGGQIVLTILKIRGNQISLGIQAPREVSVLRAELSGSGPMPVALQVGH
jgi:carbon storage regulator